MEVHAEIAVPVPPDDSVFVFDSNNGQGVAATLGLMEQNWAALEPLMSENELQQSARLRPLFDEMKTVGEQNREQKLIAAFLDNGKINAFRENVATAFDKSSRMRLIAEKLSHVKDRSRDPPPENLHSWGFNQLDDKAAFIAKWHVHYGNWGETYGRGLAQAEDSFAFEVLSNAASTKLSVKETDVVGEIANQLGARQWHRPIVLQTLRRSLGYSQIKNKESFVHRFSPDLASMAENEIDGFSGVLKIRNESVPVFDIFVREPELLDKLLIVEPSKYFEWNRYSPGAPEEAVHKLLLINVFDLSHDNERREKLLEDEPGWLVNKGTREEQDKYLKSHVVVNVYDKFEVKILEPSSGVSLTIEPQRKAAEDPALYEV